MFQAKELARLRLQKEQLASRSDANRLQLISDWQRLRSADGWLEEGVGLVKRHPVALAALATASGLLVTRLLRRPSALINGFGRLGKLASVAIAAWKLFKHVNRETSEVPSSSSRVQSRKTNSRSEVSSPDGLHEM